MRSGPTHTRFASAYSTPSLTVEPLRVLHRGFDSFIRGGFREKSALESVTSLPTLGPTSGRSCKSFAAGLTGFSGAVRARFRHAARFMSATLMSLLWLGLMARAAVDVGDPGLAGLPKQTQTISFGALAMKRYGDASFTLSATASSGLPVSFAIVTGPANLTDGNTVNLTGVGIITVRASQGGDAAYAAAPSVDQSFSVGKAIATVSPDSPAKKNYRDAPLTVNDSAVIVRGGTLAVESAVTQTFENLGAISLPESGPATTYPSTIVVAGTSGTITKVTARLNELSHTFPTDLDFLLVGPTGAKMVLMASCGSGFGVSGVTLTFDDDASQSLSTTQISTGFYRPSPRVAPTFEPPAPDSPYAARLATFFGTSANGTWSLFAYDHSAGDFGQVAGGWSLSISSTESPAISSSLLASGAVGAPFNYLVTASNSPGSYGATGLPAGLSINPATGQISGTPTAAGTYSVTLSATNALGTGTANLALTVGLGYENIASIAIPGSGTEGAAAPYPSTISVSGTSWSIGKVIVRLNQLSHTFSRDVSVLLVGPTGIKVLLLAENGGDTEASGVTLAFDDAGPELFTPLTTGTYRPTQNATLPFPAPAPSGPYASSLAGFSGKSANGTWSLYASDNIEGDLGQIAGGWSLIILPAGSAPVISSSLTAGGTVGVPISYGITASNSPASFDATGLPAGLSVNSATGAFGGTPTAAGTFMVGLSATNALGTGTADLTLTIAKGSQTITFGALANKNYGDPPFAVSATASSGLALVFSIISGPATISDTTVTLTGAGTVLVRAAQDGNANYNPAPNVDQSFTVTPNFASWQASKFTSAELLNASVSGANAVYGLDGLPNLVKYALGLEPKTNVTTGLPAVTVVGSEWHFTYTRPSSVTDLVYAVQVSTDLVTWTTTGVTHVPVSSSGDFETWRGQYPLTASNAFFRLNVTQP
jgi:subtilisin-like proprotein convertase family protein